ncbi:MAG: HAMP domain-containing protein, partial [Thermoactinospora sp.]|nr:HAMP domain-containing protein [Thermoactinospora sp.]
MRPATWTLRTRLVMAILGLTTLGLVLSNVMGIALLQDNLLRRVDEDLTVVTKVASTKRAPLVITPKPGLVSDVSEVIAKRVAAIQRFLVYDADGRVRSQIPATTSEPGPVITEIRTDAPYTVPGTSGASWRVRAAALPTGGTLVFAQSLAELDQTRTSALAIAAAVSAFALLLLGLAANAVVRLGLRPLTRMESTAGHIARGDFARRVPASDPHTEPGRLAVAMN